MIPIGQPAGYVGVSVKTVRVHHAKGLLPEPEPEPERDASGYRRYGAHDAVDDDLTARIRIRIRDLRATRGRLRRLAAGDLTPLPDEGSSCSPPTPSTRSPCSTTRPGHWPTRRCDSSSWTTTARTTLPPRIPALVQGMVNASSPAWRRLDTLVRARLGPATT
ncbi:MerR family transcriptional regulator [Streptomyces sp. NPDC002276]